MFLSCFDKYQYATLLCIAQVTNRKQVIYIYIFLSLKECEVFPNYVS